MNRQHSYHLNKGIRDLQELSKHEFFFPTSCLTNFFNEIHICYLPASDRTQDLWHSFSQYGPT